MQRPSPTFYVSDGKTQQENEEEQELPNAQLILYPDSAHGSQYQYPNLFV
jgi:hypothetical protein